MKKNEYSHDVEVINSTYFSDGFPKLEDKLIERNNIINLIESEFSDDLKVIFLEGGDDSGKTYFNAQFCNKNYSNTISVFFNPLSIIDFQIDYYISNMVSQIRYMLGWSIDEIEEKSIIGYEDYRQCLFQIRKKFKRKKDIIYLIIDGLEDKITSNPEFVKEIIDNLPIGESHFRILITGSQKEYFSLSNNLKKASCKPIPLSGFTTHEIRTYLELGDENKIDEDIYKVTKGYPGRLKTLKRILIKNNYNIDEIDSHTTYKSWIELDCSDIDLENSFTNWVLSIVAFADDKFDINQIALILSKDVEETKEEINKIYVIELQKEVVNFISKAHKAYFKNLLRSNSKKVDELLRKYYASEDSLNNKLKLISLYAKDNLWKQITPIINEELLINALKNTGTLKVVNETVELGYKAAENLKSYSDIYKYSIQGSIINELDNYLFWESEILARISLNDFIGAISLADSAVLNVDRLRLLALIAKKQKQINKFVDEQLIHLIKDIYDKIDLSGAGDIIYDIVADLIYAIPNLAIEIIENSSGDASEKNINDWIIAKLSIAAINSSENDKKDEDKKISAIQNINPSVRKINRAITFLVGNYTPSKVLEEVQKLSDSKEKLKLLRLWLINNTKHKQNVELVIDKALDELVNVSTNELLTLEVLKDLSMQLAYVKEYEKKKNILERFKLFERDIKDLGLSKDKYIYKLNIFHTEFTLNRDKSIPIINSMISEIDLLNDILVKIESYSEVYSKLHSINKNMFISKLKFIYSRILILSEELFLSTSNHYKSSKNFLKTIAKVNPIFAVKISERINIEFHRNKSKLLILDSYLDNRIQYIKIEFLKIIEEKISNELPRNIALKHILERYDNEKKLDYNLIKSLFHFTDKIPLKKDFPSNIVYYYLTFYGIISKNKDWKIKLSHSIKTSILKKWDEIEADWEKIDLGFIVSSEMSEIDKEFSKVIFEKAIEIKLNSWVDSEPIAETYTLCIRLLFKSYNGLLVSQIESIQDYSKIEKLINRLPSEVERLKLWSEFCINCLIYNKDELAKKVYDVHIISLVQGLLNKSSFAEGITESSIVIYKFNQSMAIEFIDKLNSIYAEEALQNIADYFISKRNPFDIYSGEVSKYNSTYSDIIEAINVINKINTDYTIYGLIKELDRAINNNSNRFNAIQISEISSRLNLLIDKKLPDSNNIKHIGYKVLAKARIDSINNKAFDLNYYKTQIEKIDNTSDKVFVCANLLSILPFGKIKNSITEKSDLFTKVTDEIKNIKIIYEYVQRVDDISEIMYEINKNEWKKTINNAYVIANQFDEGNEMYDYQKSIIDTIYRLDENFAKELIQLTDKERNSELLKKHYESLTITKKIKNNQSLEEKERNNSRVVIQSITKALGSLNSGMISHKKISEIYSFLNIGNKLPLREVFPIYVYYLTNNYLRFKSINKEHDTVKLQREHFDKLIEATQLVELISQKRKIKEKPLKEFFIDNDFDSIKVVNPNTREEAFNYIRDWLLEVASEFIIISDPYFSKKDIEILKIIKELDNDIEIDVLGSKDGLSQNIADEYKEYWKKISDESPPFTNFTFCWVPDDNNNQPIHDRWIITKNGGLRLGTSLNHLGIKKESEISVMSQNESLKIKEEILKEYLHRKKRYLNGLKVSYNGFTL